jgi:hypothetical protein
MSDTLKPTIITLIFFFFFLNKMGKSNRSINPADALRKVFIL